MNIIRIADRAKFTIIDNRAINDNRLSFRARGVLVWLLSKPDGWASSRESIAAASSEGLHAIRGVLKELRDAGYLVRVAVRGPDGRISAESVLYEVPPPPESAPLAENRPADNRPAVNRPAENRPAKDKRLRVKTEIKTKETPPISPPIDSFDEFWDDYPRRHGKKLEKAKALAVWKRLTITDRERAMVGVGHYRTACDEGITIAKDAHRWLRPEIIEEWQTPAEQRPSPPTKKPNALEIAFARRDKRHGRNGSTPDRGLPQIGGVSPRRLDTRAD